MDLEVLLVLEVPDILTFQQAQVLLGNQAVHHSLWHHLVLEVQPALEHHQHQLGQVLLVVQWVQEVQQVQEVLGVLPVLGLRH